MIITIYFKDLHLPPLTLTVSEGAWADMGNDTVDVFDLDEDGNDYYAAQFDRAAVYGWIMGSCRTMENKPAPTCPYCGNEIRRKNDEGEEIYI